MPTLDCVPTHATYTGSMIFWLFIRESRYNNVDEKGIDGRQGTEKKANLSDDVPRYHLVERLRNK